jgi:hypothetical protein
MWMLHQQSCGQVSQLLAVQSDHYAMMKKCTAMSWCDACGFPQRMWMRAGKACG